VFFINVNRKIYITFTHKSNWTLWIIWRLSFYNKKNLHITKSKPTVVLDIYNTTRYKARWCCIQWALAVAHVLNHQIIDYISTKKEFYYNYKNRLKSRILHINIDAIFTVRNEK